MTFRFSADVGIAGEGRQGVGRVVAQLSWYSAVEQCGNAQRSGQVHVAKLRLPCDFRWNYSSLDAVCYVFAISQSMSCEYTTVKREMFGGLKVR